MFTNKDLPLQRKSVGARELEVTGLKKWDWTEVQAERRWSKRATVDPEEICARRVGWK